MYRFIIIPSHCEQFIDRVLVVGAGVRVDFAPLRRVENFVDFSGESGRGVVAGGLPFLFFSLVLLFFSCG